MKLGIKIFRISIVRRDVGDVGFSTFLILRLSLPPPTYRSAMENSGFRYSSQARYPKNTTRINEYP
jgi:hypothetical protein